MVWMTSVSKTEFLHRTPHMIGTTFREVVADENGSTELQGVVRDYRPNQRIAFHLYGPYNVVDVEYRLETVIPVCNSSGYDHSVDAQGHE